MERVIKRAGCLASGINTSKPEVVVGNAYLLTLALEHSEILEERRDAVTAAREAFRGKKKSVNSLPAFTDQKDLDIRLDGQSMSKSPGTMAETFNNDLTMRAWAMTLIRERSREPELVEDDVRCLVFQRCQIYGEGITSLAYTRARTRVSYNVTLTTRDEDPTEINMGATRDNVVGCVHKYFMAIGVDDNRVLARFALVTKFQDDTTTEESNLGLRAVKRWGEALVPLENFLEKCMLHHVPPKNRANGGAIRIYSVPLWGLTPTSGLTRPI